MLHSKTKHVWIVKKDGRCLVACTSLKMKVQEKWYVDSGNSKHMAGNKEFLTNLQLCSLESVTFGDSAKGTVLGSGSLKIPGMPKLYNVLLVNGLKVNLISINQLCDQNLLVQFTKENCSVTNNTNSCVMEGKRSPDNFYMLTSLGTCCTTLLNNSNIWHRRLGHIIHKIFNDTIAANVVLGIPKIKVDAGKICGSCQLGKQIRSPHKVTQHLSTTRFLELIHMDLMFQCMLKALGGKVMVTLSQRKVIHF